MEQPHTQGSGPQQPSLKELVGAALDDARDLLRAEIDIAKADATHVLKLAALGMVVVTACGVLVALAISMLVAAAILALGGTPVQALLAAAAMSCVISGAAVAWLLLQLRKPMAERWSHSAHPQSVPASARERQPS